MWRRFLCLLAGHEWWEYWRFEKTDHCIRCGKEREHPTEGCTCTFCNFPEHLERLKVELPSLNWKKSVLGR